jgi:hypothetical protein
VFHVLVFRSLVTALQSEIFCSIFGVAVRSVAESVQWRFTTDNCCNIATDTLYPAPLAFFSPSISSRNSPPFL